MCWESNCLGGHHYWGGNDWTPKHNEHFLNWDSLFFTICPYIFKPHKGMGRNSLERTFETGIKGALDDKKQNRNLIIQNHMWFILHMLLLAFMSLYQPHRSLSGFQMKETLIWLHLWHSYITREAVRTWSTQFCILKTGVRWGWFSSIPSW